MKTGEEAREGDGVRIRGKGVTWGRDGGDGWRWGGI